MEDGTEDKKSVQLIAIILPSNKITRSYPLLLLLSKNISSEYIVEYVDMCKNIFGEREQVQYETAIKINVQDSGHHSTASF